MLVGRAPSSSSAKRPSGVLRPAQAYLAADKLTKSGWLWILGLTFAFTVFFPSVVGLFSIAGTVAAFVYLLDVRPALVSVMRRR